LTTQAFDHSVGAQVCSQIKPDCTQLMSTDEFFRVKKVIELECSVEETNLGPASGMINFDFIFVL